MSLGGETPLSLEQQVEILEQQLIQAQKLTALGELVGTTTHEFNNILMTILNYARHGLRYKDTATRDKALEKILAAAERAAKITNTVLGVARNRSETFEPTNLNKIVDDALALLERELSKYRIAVERDLQIVPEIPAIGNQIQQVLLNLIINARQAMPQGGRVLVRLAHDCDSDMVELVVRDTGAGIPADKLPKIFDPFYTTKSGPDETGRGGTGLGLASCRRIIEGHRGRIRVESTPGKGTAFIIKLPTSRPAVANVAIAPAPAPAMLPPTLPLPTSSANVPAG